MLCESSPHRTGAARSSPSGADRLKVLQVIGHLSESGGAERFSLGLATHLSQDRFEPWMCSPRGGEPAPIAALADAGVPFVDLGRRAKWDVHRLIGLATLLRRQRFDIVHTHLFGSNLWGVIVGRACRVPVVIAHEHTWSYEGDALRAWLDGRVIGRLATRFLAVSSADAERMIRIEHVPSTKVVVIPSAYVPRSPVAGGDLRAELGLAPGTPLLGTAAVMRPQKALDVLIEAHACVLGTVPSAHLVLAGFGECRPALERRARELGLQASTHFLGRRTDVDAILGSLDVAVMSSDFEGAPLFVYECMANRTPLVATAVGGLPDIVDDGATGILVAPRRPLELAAALTALLTDRERGRRLARAAAQRLPRYTIETISARFADLYERLAAESAGRGRPIR